MKPIILIRGVHMNELSAFQIASAVYFRIKKQECDCRLETIKEEKSMWSVLEKVKGVKDITLEQFEELVEGKVGSEREDGLAYGRDHDNTICSFHNYPIAFELQFYGSKNQIKPGVLNRDCMGRVERVHDEEQAKWEGEIVRFPSWESNLIFFEIPAFYHQMPRFNISCLAGTSHEPYLYDVDLKKTRNHGLMGDTTIDAITQSILGKTYKPSL